MSYIEALNAILRSWNDKLNGLISYQEFDKNKEYILNSCNDNIKNKVIINLQSMGMMSR